MSDEPLVILKGQVCELREAGGQVVIVQRDAVRDTPAPSDPHEDSETGLRGSGGLCGPKGPEGSPPFFSFSTVSTQGGHRPRRLLTYSCCVPTWRSEPALAPIHA